MTAHRESAIAGGRRPGRGRRRGWAAPVLALALALLTAAPATAQEDKATPLDGELRFPVKGLPDLVIPPMNATRGRVYFATRGCVVCHQVNGVGGGMGPALGTMANGANNMDVFGFVARMWRGAGPMVQVQRQLFGETIDLTAEEIADIIAFVHDPAEQKRFSEKDIPPVVRDFMVGRGR